MKGPFERLKYDPRRLWECPVCHHRERAPGDVTTRLCACQTKEEPLKRRHMRLVEEGYRRIETTVRPPAASTATASPSHADLPNADLASTDFPSTDPPVV